MHGCRTQGRYAGPTLVTREVGTIYFFLARSPLSPLSYFLFYSLKQGVPGTLWVNHPELIEHPKLCRARIGKQLTNRLRKPTE